MHSVRADEHGSGSPAAGGTAHPEHARGKPLELWWQNETRIGQQGTLTRVPAERGSPPFVPRDQRYPRAYRLGAICPASGMSAALELPTANARMMTLHLADLSACVRPVAQAVLTVDGTGRYQLGRRLYAPDTITLPHLPPCIPEPNPVENVWAILRGNTFSIRVFDTYEAIVGACCQS